jgi:predicted Na+-dependent transporter
MLVTNIVGVFSVPPLLMWMTSINSTDVDVKGFAMLMGIFVLTVILPTMVRYSSVLKTIIVIINIYFILTKERISNQRTERIRNIAHTAHKESHKLERSRAKL